MTDSILADLYSTRGDWPKALEWSEKGARESQRRGALILYERLLTSESQANLYLKRYEAAETETQEALGLATRFNDVSGQLRALNRLGQIYTAEEQWSTAENPLLGALHLEQELDQKQRQVHTLLNLSRLNDKQQKLEAASTYAAQAMHLADSLGHVEVQTEVRLQMATLLGEAGSRTEALKQLAEVHASAVKINDTYLQEQATSASAAILGRP